MENRSPVPQPVSNSSSEQSEDAACPALPGPVPLNAEQYSDDMCDSKADRDKYPDLPLDECATLLHDYRCLDQEAIDFQDSHVAHTRTAAIFGMLAVIAAIGELALSYNDSLDFLKAIIALAEIVCVAVAGFAAFHGSWKKKKERWLETRHQAELYRQLKFTLLIHPEVWGDAAWREKQVKKFSGRRNEAWLKLEIENPPPHGLLEIEEKPLKWPTLRQLVEYYIAKRLNPQQEYLANRAQQDQYKDLFRHWPDVLFAVSVLFAGVHFAFFLTKHWPLFAVARREETSGVVFWTALFLLGAAAALPVFGAAARTWRAAFEFSRNKSRFHATHTALEQVEVSLLHDALAGPVDSADPKGLADRSLKVLRELWWAEHILCNEHHEWLRLMLEAEWLP
jgi:hypothetical protein